MTFGIDLWRSQDCLAPDCFLAFIGVIKHTHNHILNKFFLQSFKYAYILVVPIV